MAGKIRHLKERNGRYSARIVVPPHLRIILGKTELESQLGADRKQALAKHPSAVAELQNQIALAENQLNEPKQESIRFPIPFDQIAIRHYQSLIALDEEIRLSDPRFANIGFDDAFVEDLRAGIAGKLNDDQLDAIIGDRVRRFRLLGNTDVQKGSAEWRKLAMTLCVAEYEAIALSAERDEGDFTGAPEHPLLLKAATTPEPEPELQTPPVDIMVLFDDYFKDLERNGRGRVAHKKWAPVFKDLVKTVGHSDAARLTSEDIFNWRNKKLETLSTKTVADTYLVSVRTVLTWAVSERKLTNNPTQGVKVRKVKPIQNREKGFRDNEALAILQTCRAYIPNEVTNPANREAEKTTAAKRWASILCAFTGARITELMQLRKMDIRKEGEISIIRLTPDAGSIKNYQYRDVPIHPQLISEGFLDFVDGSKDGALFHYNEPDKALTGAQTVAKRVAVWLQSTELIPEGVSPNHGFRHRFKAVGEEIGISTRVLDAIQGHAPRTAGESYGDISILAKHRAVIQFPKYQLSTKTT